MPRPQLDVDAARTAGSTSTLGQERFSCSQSGAWAIRRNRPAAGQVKVNGEGFVSARPEAGVGLSATARLVVSYEVFVPAKQDLNLRSVNGGLHVQEVRAMKLETVNGGID